MRVQYYQGPGYHIAMMMPGAPGWRMTPRAPPTMECGRSGNSRYLIPLKIPPGPGLPQRPAHGVERGAPASFPPAQCRVLQLRRRHAIDTTITNVAALALVTKEIPSPFVRVHKPGAILLLVTALLHRLAPRP